MNRLISKPQMLAAGAILAAATLAGCGRQAALERPSPMFAQANVSPTAVPGTPVRADPSTSVDTQTSREAAARARRDAANSNPDPDAPQSTQELRRFQDQPITPARADPIGGAPNDPNASPPQGVIPDPLNHPEGGPYA